MALYLAILVLVVLSIFMIKYYDVSRHARWTAFRLEKDEILRQMAESAMEEAFCRLQVEAESQDSETMKAFQTPTASAFEIPLALTPEKLVARWVPAGLNPQVVAEARILHYRVKDSAGNPFFCDTETGISEKIGVVELKVRASLKMPFQALGDERSQVTLVRHHDFKLAALVTPGEGVVSRTSHAQTFPLDYALLVRDGFEEFKQTNGESLNPPENITVRVEQPTDEAAFGQIFFGGTADLPAERNHVFLNLTDEHAALYPKLPHRPPAQEGNPYPASCCEKITEQKFLELIPEQKAAKEAHEAAVGGGAYEHDTWKGSWGYIINTIEPITLWLEPSQPSENAAVAQSREIAKTSIAQGQGNSYLANRNPGIRILPLKEAAAMAPDFPGKILRGDIRQRVTYNSEAYIDLTQAKHHLAKMLTAAAHYTHFPLLASSSAVESEENARSDSQLSIVATFVALPYKPGIEISDRASVAKAVEKPGFVSPNFFTRSGTACSLLENECLPCRLSELFAAVFRSKAEMEYFGLISTTDKKLRLHGLWEICGERLTLADAGSLTYSGKGALLCRQGFDVNCGVVREADDPEAICLFGDFSETPSSLSVPPNLEIQAGIMAMNEMKTGAVVPKTGLNLLGTFAVDRLKTQSWPSNQEHSIRYDPVFKRKTSLWVLNILRPVSFQRMTRGSS
jgi:hypothetical protein